ncbi:retrovirus-related pol polyprotein from transposon TNT 1-94 [Tanacetum coccineum]
MLITSGALHSLWGEACLAANTILNKLPYKKSDKSPYQLWKGKQPSYKMMKVWGCLAKVQIPLPKRTKLGPKIVDCVYLGPAKNNAAYRFLVYKSNDKEKQISNPRKRVIDDQLSQDETYNNYEAAMESSKAPYWKEAIHSEIDSIMNNNTWKWVDLPSGHKPIGHKRIFKKKLRPDGTIEKYKSHLVAKRCPAIHNLIIHQMDVKIAFLNGELDEEIYMQQPEGFVVKCQEHKKTLNKFGHYDDRPVVTPFDPKVQLKKNKRKSVSQLQYTQVLGSLTYIMNCTRPDLAYSVSRLSRYSHNPGRDHWDALVRMLQYLKHTMDYGLHYTKYPPLLEGLCDANWISNHNKGKSTSVYVFTLGGAVVSWKSSKQTMNTKSTMDAEFVALDKGAKEAEWLKSFLEGTPLCPKLMIDVCIHYDSMAALTREENHIYNGKSRHIRRRHNTIKDLLRNGIIPIDYVKSKENIVDPLTKGLCREQVIFTSRGMGLKPTQ